MIGHLGIVYARFLTELSEEGWLANIVQSVYRNAQSCTRVYGTFSIAMPLVQVLLHQGSVLTLLLFIIVLGRLYTKSRPGCPALVC